MQNADGKMYTRDYYEKMNGIKRPTRTRCLWIYANNLKCVSNALTAPVALTKFNTNIRDSDDEIECIQDSDEEMALSKSLKISTVVGGFQEVL
jgi:hypothetical protein